MKKAIISGLRQAEIIEVPTPHAYKNWVLVKIHSAPMCTEYKSFTHGEQSMFLGHEAAGEVAAIDDYPGLKVGDRVVVMPLNACGVCEYCRRGDFIYCVNQLDLEHTGNQEGSATFAQYLLKPGHLLMPIPDDVSYDMASLACCGLGPSFGALRKMNIGAFDTLLITGLGPVGLGAVVNAKYMGARVIAADSVEYRRIFASQLGADEVIDVDENIQKTIERCTNGKGVDCALDCSGSPLAHRTCLNAVRRCGQVTFIGESHQDTIFSISSDLLYKGVTVRGSWHYNISEYWNLMEIIHRGIMAKKLISHTFPLSDVQKAFERSASPEHAKIILKPWESVQATDVDYQEIYSKA